VLRAATAAAVRRVVLTSSTDAITAGHDPADHRVRTEVRVGSVVEQRTVEPETVPPRRAPAV